MKLTLIELLTSMVLITAMGLTALAQQTVAPPQAPLRARGAAQQPLRDAAKAAKQANQQPRNLAADQPKLNQQQRNRMANAIVDRYLGGFQKNVGLTDELTQKLSPVLGRYVRQQLMLAQRRTDAIKRLTELSDQQASEEELQTQRNELELTEKQLINRERGFYAEMNPQLTPQQQAQLKLYMIRTDQNLRQAIQKSSQ